MKQSFHDFVRSFDEKIGLKSKTLFKLLKHIKSSIGGSVVELSPAPYRPGFDSRPMHSRKNFLGKSSLNLF